MISSFYLCCEFRWCREKKGHKAMVATRRTGSIEAERRILSGPLERNIDTAAESLTGKICLWRIVDFA